MVRKSASLSVDFGFLSHISAFKKGNYRSPALAFSNGINVEVLLICLAILACNKPI